MSLFDSSIPVVKLKCARDILHTSKLTVKLHACMCETDQMTEFHIVLTLI